MCAIASSKITKRRSHGNLAPRKLSSVIVATKHVCKQCYGSRAGNFDGKNWSRKPKRYVYYRL